MKDKSQLIEPLTELTHDIVNAIPMVGIMGEKFKQQLQAHPTMPLLADLYVFLDQTQRFSLVEAIKNHLELGNLKTSSQKILKLQQADEKSLLKAMKQVSLKQEDITSLNKTINHSLASGEFTLKGPITEAIQRVGLSNKKQKNLEKKIERFLDFQHSLSKMSQKKLSANELPKVIISVSDDDIIRVTDIVRIIYEVGDSQLGEWLEKAKRVPYANPLKEPKDILENTDIKKSLGCFTASSRKKLENTIKLVHSGMPDPSIVENKVESFLDELKKQEKGWFSSTHQELKAENFITTDEYPTVNTAKLATLFNELGTKSKNALKNSYDQLINYNDRLKHTLEGYMQGVITVAETSKTISPFQHVTQNEFKSKGVQYYQGTFMHLLENGKHEKDHLALELELIQSNRRVSHNVVLSVISATSQEFAGGIIEKLQQAYAVLYNDMVPSNLKLLKRFPEGEQPAVLDSVRGMILTPETLGITMPEGMQKYRLEKVHSYDELDTALHSKEPKVSRFATVSTPESEAPTPRTQRRAAKIEEIAEKFMEHYKADHVIDTVAAMTGISAGGALTYGVKWRLLEVVNIRLEQQGREGVSRPEGVHILKDDIQALTAMLVYEQNEKNHTHPSEANANIQKLSELFVKAIDMMVETKKSGSYTQSADSEKQLQEQLKHEISERFNAKNFSILKEFFSKVMSLLTGNHAISNLEGIGKQIRGFIKDMAHAAQKESTTDQPLEKHRRSFSDQGKISPEKGEFTRRLSESHLQKPSQKER